MKYITTTKSPSQHKTCQKKQSLYNINKGHQTETATETNRQKLFNAQNSEG